MSRAPVDGVFPITDLGSAIMARRMARASIHEATFQGLPLTEVESAMEEFRLHWRRRRKELGLHSLPEDPFDDTPDG